MIRRWERIISGRSATAVIQDKGRVYDTDEIKGYYNDLTGKVSAGTILDSDGLPLTQIGSGQMVHFPIAVFQYGLGCYDIFLENPERKEKLSTVINIAEWAVRQQRGDGSWDCFSPLKSNKYTVSSMGQGEGASLLFRAYAASGREEFKLAAFHAIDFMLRGVGDGGVTVYENNQIFLEEYPQTPRRSVLNGWIFSMFGLYDAALMDEKYMGIFKQCAKTLADNIDLYDNGYWSYYDLEKRIASPAYHALHIALLEVVAELSGEKKLALAAERYKLFNASFFNRTRAIVTKLWQKLTEKPDAIVIQ